MTLKRAQEILTKINCWELDGKGDFAEIQTDQEGWQAFADEIGITLDELDEFVTLHLMGCLDSDDDWPGDDEDDFEPAMPEFDAEAWEEESGTSCQVSDSRSYSPLSTGDWFSDANQAACDRGGDDD